MITKISIRTHSRTELLDITTQIQNIVSESAVKNGICSIWVPHTTAAITINENADPTVQQDILKELNKIVPFQDNYAHFEGNSAAHIKSSIVGCSQTILIEEGRLMLGTWQGIFFCEFDGPRHRQVWVKIIEG